MRSYGQTAYEAYCDHRKWKSFYETDLPPWAECTPDIQEGWEVAANAAIEAKEIQTATE